VSNSRRYSTNMDNERLSPVMVMVIVLAVLGFMGVVIYVLDNHLNKRLVSTVDPVRGRLAHEAQNVARNQKIKSKEQDKEEQAKAQQAGHYV